LAREDFTIGAVGEEALGQAAYGSAVPGLDGTEKSPVPVGFHDPQQFRFAQLPDRGESLGQNLAMTPMGTEDMILGSQRERHPDGGGLLSDREVSRPGVIVRDAFAGPLGLDLVENRFEFPDRAHVLPDAQEVFGRMS